MYSSVQTEDVSNEDLNVRFHSEDMIWLAPRLFIISVSAVFLHVAVRRLRFDHKLQNCEMAPLVFCDNLPLLELLSCKAQQLVQRLRYFRCLEFSGLAADSNSDECQFVNLEHFRKIQI